MPELYIDKGVIYFRGIACGVINEFALFSAGPEMLTDFKKHFPSIEESITPEVATFPLKEKLLLTLEDVEDKLVMESRAGFVETAWVSQTLATLRSLGEEE